MADHPSETQPAPDVGRATLGPWIIERRLQLGLTQTELAEKTGILRTTLNNIERGKVSFPSIENRRRLADALRVRHVDLLVAAGELDDTEIDPIDLDDPRWGNGLLIVLDQPLLLAKLARLTFDQRQLVEQLVDQVLGPGAGQP